MKLLLLLLLLISPSVFGNRIVTTNNGPIRGISLTGKKVEAFLGVPYAEPPVGELRFARPVPKTPWKQAYEANELPPSCIQIIIDSYYAPHPDSKMSEDCLYLNLWVPEGGSDQKPIMIFIHGGGYTVGSTNMKLYDGAVLSEHGDVIVATVNYRLGTLGYFSGFIDDAEGSMGMYDQVMAIQWIKDNAKHFGGDPENIVLFGESAGSFSVSLHMVSPLSKNLFRRGILQSGSFYHPTYSDDNKLLLLASQAAASTLGCASDDESLKKNPKEVVDCLKRVPAEKFPEADLSVMEKVSWIYPRVGNDFLPKNPIDLYKKCDLQDKEVLLGVTRDEGAILLTSQRPDIFGHFGEKADSVVLNDTFSEEVIRSILKSDDENIEIFQRYLDRVRKETRYTHLNALVDFLGDYYFNCGAVFQANYQSLKNVPVYFYIFDQRPSSTVQAEWMGTTHFEEVQYVFGNPLYKAFSKFEEEFSRDMMDMWAAFARTGNPNIPGGLNWPRYTFKDPKYFVIGKRDKVGVRPDNYRCEVWKKPFRFEIDDD